MTAQYIEYKEYLRIRNQTRCCSRWVLPVPDTMFRTREEIRDADICTKELAAQNAYNVYKFNLILEAQDLYWEIQERAEELGEDFSISMFDFVKQKVRDYCEHDVELYTEEE